MMWYVECDMIQKMKFVWNTMITPLEEREHNSNSATLLSVMLAAYVAITGYVDTV